MKTFYRIHWQNDEEAWSDDVTYSSESKAVAAGERECSRDRSLYFTVEEEEACDDEEADY